MQHPFPSFGTKAAGTLLSGGIVLLPTANLWQVVAHGGKPSAVRKLLEVCPPGPFSRPELLFADTDALRKWCPRINPALDTLLFHHRRPLTLSVPAGPKVPLSLIDHRGEVRARLALDSYTYRLCEDLEYPLIACFAAGPGATEIPLSFGRIRSDVLERVDHTVLRRQLERVGDGPAIAVRMEDGKDIEFLPE